MENQLYDEFDPRGTGIRLLRILPRHNQGIEATLTTFLEHEHYPPYYALSYTWGPESLHEDILVHAKSLCIRRNIWTFSATIFEIGKPEGEAKGAVYTAQWLWIDQIYIEQSSFCEKNHQIPRIATIHAQPQQVLVWLGEDKHDALRTMSKSPRRP